MSVRVSNTSIDALRSQYRRPRADRCLGAQEIERLDGIIPGDRIVCTHGVLWVTQEGDREDYLLMKGEKFVAKCAGLVLVQALKEPASWCLFKSASAGWKPNTV